MFDLVAKGGQVNARDGLGSVEFKFLFYLQYKLYEIL